MLDLIKDLLPFIITTLVGAVGVVTAGWVAVNKAAARVAKISTAIAVATQDKQLTGDEINDIIDSFKGDLNKAKEEIRNRTL